jgi:hypothetical protein
MKTILMLGLAFVITASASAQKNSPYRYSRPRTHTSVSIGIGGGYSPYYSPLYRPYPYYSTPIYPRTPVYSRPTGLDMEIADIKADYDDRIWSARHDNSLSKSERKSEIRRLKSERDRAVRNAEYSYHRKR